MVTGIETAGVILALFPIVVKGLTGFAESVNKVKLWRKYRVQLEDYAIQIESHRVFYLDTLEELLNGVVDSDDVQAEMIQNPGEGPWLESEYEDTLRARLDRSYDTYVATMQMLLRNLQELESRLYLGKLNGHGPEYDSLVRREIKALKLVLSRNVYEELLSKIERANKGLREFTHQSLLLEPSRKSRKCSVSKEEPGLNTIRKYSKSLYDLIIGDKLWKCQCRTNHVVNLGLDISPAVGIHIILQSERDTLTQENRDPRVCWKWQGFKVRSREFVTQQTSSITSKCIIDGPKAIVENAKATGVSLGPAGAENSSNLSNSTGPLNDQPDQIFCFCETVHKLHIIKEPPTKKCIGLLLDTTTCICQHEIFPTQDLIPADTELPRSLETVLETNAIQGSGRIASRKYRRKSVSRGDRLYIAMVLASSILLIDDLGFENNFRSRNIVIFRPTEVHGKLKRRVFIPYLSRQVVSSNSGLPSLNALEKNLTRNEALLGLFLTLVALSFGQRLADLQEPEDIVQDHNLMTDFNTATRLLPDVFDECGDNYESAVHWCFDSLLQTGDCSFENETFFREMFNNVVTPLKEDWKNFSGDLHPTNMKRHSVSLR